jgi:hypothetical protein
MTAQAERRSVRVVACILGVGSLGAPIVWMFQEFRLPWYFLVSSVLVGLLLLPVAFKGRAPNWFQRLERSAGFRR